ncbi:hypothetical protein QM806_36555 [Rhodococcus sp. IEGM 1351]|uniref:hypothetical protein n=1 Tax=Rhodococcus sp. IEGM 1351 TaxID=3047089 RepID=UPI0024B79ACD|nr:hypothetical protein [Rhodococcus sp. IEGM 1351]MDI9940874.1 hypothetical protein [Rhodococcus sp. IEGM 1351]
MNDQAQLHELPAYWRDRLRRLRVENQKMRRQRNAYRDQLITAGLEPIEYEETNA